MEIEGEERKVIIVDSEHPLLQVVGDNNCSKANLTQQKVAMTIEEQEVKVVVRNVGEEKEMQPSFQSQHTEAIVVSGTGSLQVAAKAEVTQDTEKEVAMEKVQAHIPQENELQRVEVGSDYISSSIQVPDEANATQPKEEHEVNTDSVGEECELQPSQSPHKKQKKSHTCQVQPDGVLADSGSVQVEAQTHDIQQKNDQVGMDIEEEEVKVVGVGNLEENVQFMTLLRMTQHNKPKKLHIAQVKPQDYMCTEEDYPLLEYLKLEPEDKVLVNIDGAWLKRKDMECMFNDNMQFDDNVLSAYIHCIRDEKHLLRREGGVVFLENTFICSLLERDGDPTVTLSYKTDNITERVQNYLKADMVFLPINIKKCHWYLAVVCGQLEEVHVLDSLGLMFSGRTELKIVLKGLERQIKCALEHDRNLDRGKWKNLDVSTWSIIEKIQEPMQKDGISCGLWMVNFMEYWTGSSLSDEVTQDDINNFRFKLPAILWDSTSNIRNVHRELKQPSAGEDSPSDVEIIDITTDVPKPSTRIFMNREELLHRVSTYIWSIDNQEWLDKEWVLSTTPYPISISLRTIRDILDKSKPMDSGCFNMAVRTVACNEARFIIEEDKWCFMDLKFCDIAQIGRDTRCRDEINYEELAGLFECWTPCYYIKDCSTVLLPYHRDRLYILFIIDMRKKIVYIMDPLAPKLKYTGTDRCSPYLTTLHDIAYHFNHAMKLANATWNIDISEWHPEVPTWTPKNYSWKVSGFLVYSYLKEWDGNRLFVHPGGGSLRTECLVDILQSNQNERANIIPEELRDLLKQLGTYL
ncbi:hypothetical protein SORBI_3009G101600 [Sorghum bicolor]|uniref:Ubiquitin-like protease family profile domain-containing protein n=1 Tax=Sorghum bicolor TaxID=4558 RepID=A0A1Z5R2V9_SORBI|nr:hypothetical protein SORBI_3009G101600 [Sorghum bicolor]